MSTTLTIILTIGALSAVCCLALLVAMLVSPGRPERNSIGHALRDRSKGFGALDEPILSWPVTDDHARVEQAFRAGPFGGAK